MANGIIANILLSLKITTIMLCGIQTKGIGLAEAFSSGMTFATKTTYRDQQSMNHSSMPEGFDVLYVDGLFRHGTRFPGGEKLKKWKKHFMGIQKKKEHAVIAQAIKTWDKDFSPENIYMLHNVGRTELSQIADSVYHKVRSPFFNNNNGSIRFMSSPKMRTKQSACVFINQLLCLTRKDLECTGSDETLEGEDNNVSCSGIPLEVNSHLLRSFEHCPKYVYQVEENKTAKYEPEMFARSHYINRTIEEISLKMDYSLTWPVLLSLYQYCAFDFALHNKTGICNLFNDEQLQIMEYYSDLNHYYKTGHGYKINYELSCWLMQDILNGFNNAIQGQTGATFRFGHAETLIPLLSLLGLYNDTKPLTAHSFLHHGSRRLFRTGSFSPFGGNVLFVLYRTNHSSHDDDVKFSVVINGRIAQLPGTGCHECDYSKVKKLLFNKLLSLNCSAMCKFERFPESLQKAGRTRDEL